MDTVDLFNNLLETFMACSFNFRFFFVSCSFWNAVHFLVTLKYADVDVQQLLFIFSRTFHTFHQYGLNVYRIEDSS